MQTIKEKFNFNVGDIVKYLGNDDSHRPCGHIGKIVEANDYNYLIEFNNWEHGHNGLMNDDNRNRWFVNCSDKNLVKFDGNEKNKAFTITIISDGIKKITAVQTDKDGNEISRGEAFCCPEDVFNKKTGIELAINRMIENENTKRANIGDCIYVNEKACAPYVTGTNNQFLVVDIDSDGFYFCIPLDKNHNDMLSDYIKNGVHRHSNCYTIPSKWVDFERSFTKK